MLGRHGVGPEWYGGFGWVLPVLVLLLLVPVAVLAFFMFKNRPSSVSENDPLRSAARRYANGDLDRAGFERVQKDLAALPHDPLRAAASRLARGEISISEFEEIRGQLEPDEDPDTSGDADSDDS